MPAQLKNRKNPFSSLISNRSHLQSPYKILCSFHLKSGQDLENGGQLVRMSGEGNDPRSSPFNPPICDQPQCVTLPVQSDGQRGNNFKSSLKLLLCFRACELLHLNGQKHLLLGRWFKDFRLESVVAGAPLPMDVLGGVAGVRI